MEICPLSNNLVWTSAADSLTLWAQLKVCVQKPSFQFGDYLIHVIRFSLDIWVKSKILPNRHFCFWLWHQIFCHVGQLSSRHVIRLCCCSGTWLCSAAAPSGHSPSITAATNSYFTSWSEFDTLGCFSWCTKTSRMDFMSRKKLNRRWGQWASNVSVECQNNMEHRKHGSPWQPCGISPKNESIGICEGCKGSQNSQFGSDRGF